MRAVRDCWQAVLSVLSCCTDEPETDPSQGLLTGQQDMQQSALSLQPAQMPSAPLPSQSTHQWAAVPAPVHRWGSSAPDATPPAATAASLSSVKADPLAGTVPASLTVDSLESYNAMLGALATQGEVKRSDSLELNIETCAVCCSDIVLGPQAALKRMVIPPGEAPRHFDCGHMLHADCFAVYICSHGRSCPICKLDRATAKSARELLRMHSGEGSPQQVIETAPEAGSACEPLDRLFGLDPGGDSEGSSAQGDLNEPEAQELEEHEVQLATQVPVEDVRSG